MYQMAFHDRAFSFSLCSEELLKIGKEILTKGKNIIRQKKYRNMEKNGLIPYLNTATFI
jgi:hypothetical protein